MKIVLEPVYTHKPSVCSTSYLCQEIIRDLSEWRSDAFFYLTYPKKHADDPVEQAFLLQRPDRVTLIPVEEQDRDRMWKMFEFSRDLKTVLAPGNSPVWDMDLIATSRLPQIVNMRASLSRREAMDKGTSVSIIGLDEMPIFSFRKTVAWGASGEFELHMLAAYLQSNGVIVNNLWTKTNLLQVARQYLAPSKVRELYELVHEAVPVTLKPLQLKDNPYKPGAPFNVVFTGRVTGTRNFVGVADVFRKHFSYAINKGHVRFLVSTHSQTFGAQDPGEIDFLEVQHNSREEFYGFLNGAQVAVNLSTVEDFSLSTYEPLLHGVPVVVADEPCSEFLGDDYPFRVKSSIEAYGMVKKFIEDYATMYARFRQWSETTWLKLVKDTQEARTSEILKRLVIQHEARIEACLRTREKGASYRKVVDAVTKTDLSIVDIKAWAEEKKMISSPKNWSGVPIGRRPSMFLLKEFMRRAGWRDTNACGVMIR